MRKGWEGGRAGRGGSERAKAGGKAEGGREGR